MHTTTWEALFIETQQRMRRINERAAFLAALGPTPTTERIPPFARRVRPLAATFEVRHRLTALPVPIAEKEAA